MTTHPAPAIVPLAASGSSIADLAAEEAERERGLAALTTFKRFNPPNFDVEAMDPWIVESWIATMETLVENIYTLERDKVHLAAHCFKKSAQVWWRGVKKNRTPDLHPVT